MNTIEEAEEHLDRSKHVLTNIKTHLPYVQSVPDEPIKEEKYYLEGEEHTAYVFESEKMETVDVWVKDRVLKLRPNDIIPPKIENIKLLLEKIHECFVLDDNIKKQIEIAYGDVLDTWPEYKHIVSINKDMLSTLVKSKKESFVKVGDTVFYKSGGVVNRDYANEFSRDCILDKLHRESKVEALNMFYTPEGMNTIDVVDGIIYIRDIDVFSSTTCPLEVEDGRYVVGRIEFKTKWPLTKASRGRIEGEIIQLDVFGYTWKRRGCSIPDIGDDKNFYQPLEYDTVYNNLFDRLGRQGKDKVEFIKTLFKELPDLNQGWDTVGRTIVQTIAAGQFAFSAACLSHSMYHSYDFKLENWGYKQSKNTGEGVTPCPNIKVYVGEIHMSIIDHGSYQLNTDESTKRLLLDRRHSIWTDGPEYLFAKDDTVFLNPYLLPSSCLLSDSGYPYSIPFEPLPEYDDIDLPSIPDLLRTRLRDLQDNGRVMTY